MNTKQTILYGHCDGDGRGLYFPVDENSGQVVLSLVQNVAKTCKNLPHGRGYIFSSDRQLTELRLKTHYTRTKKHAV